MAYNRSAHPENTLKWDEVAEKLNSKTGLKRRGKQCRDR